MIKYFWAKQNKIVLCADLIFWYDDENGILSLSLTRYIASNFFTVKLKFSIEVKLFLKKDQFDETVFLSRKVQ